MPHLKSDNKLPPGLHFLTYERLSTVKFSNTDILKIIENLDPNKEPGHDKISIRMMPICKISICRPLGLIFNDCLENGIFPSERKKGNIVSAHKTKINLVKITTILFLYFTICGKILERLLFNAILNFFNENDVIITASIRFLSSGFMH